MDLTNQKQSKLSEERKRWEFLVLDRTYQKYEESKFKMNVDYVRIHYFIECEREQMVSFLPLLPLIEENTYLDEADYILYMHPYARIQDASPVVMRELMQIDQMRKEGAEIIVVGKAVNIEKKLNGAIKNITFWGDHFTEKLGKRFGLNIKERYFVYDDEDEKLNIWPVDGCLRKCAFCRRTYMEIKFESLSLHTIKENLDFLKEVAPKKLQHIVLRAENLTQYGIDLYGMPKLHELLRLVNSYQEVKRITFEIGLVIGEMTPEITAAICECKYIPVIQMNLEVGSERLLKLVGEKHTKKQAIEIFDQIHKYHPEAKIESSIIIGLPTEELSDIYDLAQLIIRAKPDFVFCNFYWVAPDHPLAKLPQLSENLREYHLEYLKKLLKKGAERSLTFESYYIFKNKSSKYTLKAKMLMKQDREETGFGSHYRDILEIIR